MKENVRAIGIDDAPFEFSEEEVLVVGSLLRAPNYLEGILSTKVKIDGEDATEKIADMITGSRFEDQPSIIFTDGAAVGGFNLVDLEELNESTGIPAASISRDKPDFDNIRTAMKDHFDDWEKKFEKIKKGKIHEIETDHKPIFAQVEGTDIETVKSLIDIFTVLGRLPEPIRISHIVASGIKRGESMGKP